MAGSRAVMYFAIPGTDEYPPGYPDYAVSWKNGIRQDFSTGRQEAANYAAAMGETLEEIPFDGDINTAANWWQQLGKLYEFDSRLQSLGADGARQWLADSGGSSLLAGMSPLMLGGLAVGAFMMLRKR